MKLAVGMLKANNEEWLFTYCLIKLWCFFLQDVLDIKNYMCPAFKQKNPNWQDQGRKISWELLSTDTMSDSEGP